MQEIAGTIAEALESAHDMGFDIRLEPFGKGYRLVVGDIHIYFGNEELTYTGWGRKFGESKEVGE